MGRWLLIIGLLSLAGYFIIFTIEQYEILQNIKSKKKKVNNAEENTIFENNSNDKIQTYIDNSGEPVYVYSFKLVGSTFNNDDGTSRIEYLRKLYTGLEEFNLNNMIFEQYKYNNQPAIKVLVNGFQIGNVPKEDVLNVLDLIKEHPNYEKRIKFIGSLDTHLGMYIKIRWKDED